MINGTCLVWLLIDGLSWRLVQMRAAGTRQDSTLTRSLRALSPRRALPLIPLAPNCQTPPSLFSIFSGVDVERHRLTGYHVPAPTPDDPLRVADAFDIWPRNIPMIWDRWATEHSTFRLCAMPFVQPNRLGDALIRHTRVYGGLAIAPDVLGDGQRFCLPQLDLDLHVEAYADGVMLIGPATEHDPISYWIPLDHTVHLPVTAPALQDKQYQALAVRTVRIDGDVKLISFGYRAVDDTNPTRTAASPRAYIAGNPAQLYQANRLGRRLDDGGHGNAERLLLTLLREVHFSFAADIVGAVRAGDADCVIGYYPVIDLLSHHLLKYIDPSRTESDASRLCNALFDEALDWVDELLDGCVAAAPRPVCCIAHSDHGMAPVHHDLFPNYYFEQSGLLFYDANEQIDFERSAAIFHPAENGLVLFNEARLSILGLDRDGVTAQWRAALPAPLRGSWDMFDGTKIDAPSVCWSAQHYWQAPPGSRLLAKRSSCVAQVSRKGGDHSVWSNDAWLQGILVDVGPVPADLPADGSLALPKIADLVLRTRIRHLEKSDRAA